MNSSQPGRKVTGVVTLDGLGRYSDRLTVLCSKKGAVLPVSSCVDCQASSGFSHDERGRTWVMCDPNPLARPGGAAHFDPRHARVCDLMSTDVVCVREDVPLRAIATLLVEQNLSGVPVVDVDGRPVGMVSKTDLVTAHLKGQGRSALFDGAFASFDPDIEPASMPPGVVNDVMTPFAFSVRETTAIADAAKLMSEEGVHRLVVLDAERRVVGVLTALDVVGWLAT